MSPGIFLNSVILAALMGTAGFGQPITLKDYEIIQYITAEDAAPENILDLDNNAAIIMACREGATRTQLGARGIAFNASQIKLLEAWRLIDERSDSILFPGFPIIDPPDMTAIREETQRAADRIGPRIRADVDLFTRQLTEIHRERNAYCIMFSYIVDGLVWQRFEERKLVRKNEVTAATPFWAGEVWALRPRRDFANGTNSLADKGIAFKIGWCEALIPKMVPFVADWKNLGQMFDDYVAFGRLRDTTATRVFAPYNLFDSLGQFTVPVIREESSDSLYSTCSRLGDNITDEIVATLDLARLQEQFHFRDRDQTLVIVYHEFMWDLMNWLEEHKGLSKPRAFAKPQTATPRDIADLVFIVREKLKH